MNKILRNGIIAAIVLGTVGTSSFYNYTYAKGSGAVEEGDGAQAYGENSVAIGDASAQDDSAVAIGYNARAQGKYAVALGRNAIVEDERSIAVGLNATVKGSSSVAVGDQAYAIENYTSAFGQGATGGGCAHRHSDLLRKPTVSIPLQWEQIL